ncbi:hypothetical protein BY996DRAFT_6412742 [Phakopsora pachyrhizi]|nr:hypothetical protein BY996DRAFT_6412742 [Phakopsora pachyrhizi]
MQLARRFDSMSGEPEDCDRVRRKDELPHSEDKTKWTGEAPASGRDRLPDHNNKRNKAQEIVTGKNLVMLGDINMKDGGAEAQSVKDRQQVLLTTGQMVIELLTVEWRAAVMGAVAPAIGKMAKRMMSREA